MFITKMSLPRRTFLRGIGRHGRAAVARCDGAGAHRAGQDRREPDAPVRRRLRPARRGRWTSGRPHAAGAGFEFTPILKPLEPFRDQLVVVSELRNDRRRGTHHAQRPALADRRRPQADRSRGRPGRHHRSDRSPDRSAQDTPFPSLESGDRGFHRLHRRLRHRLQLRVHEHDLVADADDAAADGDQSARGVRAAVRPAGHAAPSGWRACSTTAASSIPCSDDAARAQRGLGPRDRVRSTSTSTTSARSSGGFRRPSRTRRHGLTVPDAPVGVPDSTRITRADVRPAGGGVQADLTRVFTFMMAREASQRIYPEIGFTEPHHHDVASRRTSPRRCRRLVKLKNYTCSCSRSS